MNSPRVRIHARMRVYVSGALWMFPPSRPRHNRRAMCTTPSVPHPVFSSSPLNPAAPVPFHIHPFRPHWRFTSLCASSRLISLARSLFPFLLSPCRNLPSPPRRPRSRCNERYTLSSSCSRRRCFHSAAQSVSARLPVRFVQGEMRVRTDAGRTSVTHESRRTRRETRALARSYLSSIIAMLETHATFVLVSIYLSPYVYYLSSLD